MNLIFSSYSRWIFGFLAIVIASFSFSALAHEYEVDGRVSQTIATRNGGKLYATATFTVFVRDCGWLIQTMETNEIGNISRREIGSTNGTEIYECELPLGKVQPITETTNAVSSPASAKRSSPAMFAVMLPGSIPVGELDSAVVGHLWLMFASQCYWPNLKTDQLTPVFDWHASVGAHGQDLKVRAGWNLLNESGSLPREVRYFGQWDETNALYTITGTNAVGGTLVPTGFTFQRFQVGPLKENSFIHEMVAVKRVDVEVTALRPGCSRISLIPSPNGPAVVIDRRFDSGLPNRPPSYQNPVSGQWPTIDKSKELAQRQQAADLRALDQMKWMREQKQSGNPARRSRVVLILMSILLFGPPIIYFALKRSKKS